LTLASASTVAFGQQPVERWYAGGSIGQSKVKFDDSVVAVPGAATSIVAKDETDTAYKLYTGYRFNPNIAVEGGWIDFGKFRIRRDVNLPFLGSAQLEMKVSGWNIDAVGMFPVGNRFSLFGRLGGLYSTAKTSRTGTGAVTVAPGVASAKKSEFDLHWGLGASYDFSRTVAVRAEYEQAQKVGDSSTGEGDVSLLSVGVVVKF
jgi:OOP family OmpA-OmpF porin